MQVSKMLSSPSGFRKIIDNLPLHEVDKNVRTSETLIYLFNYIDHHQIHVRIIHKDFSIDGSKFNICYYDELYQLDCEFNIENNLNDLIPTIFEQIHKFEQEYNKEYNLSFPPLSITTEEDVITRECINNYQESIVETYISK